MVRRTVEAALPYHEHVLFSEGFWKPDTIPVWLLRPLFAFLLDVGSMFCIFSSQELEQVFDGFLASLDVCPPTIRYVISRKRSPAGAPLEASNFPRGAFFDFLTGPDDDLALRFTPAVVEGACADTTVAMLEGAVVESRTSLERPTCEAAVSM